MKKCNCKTNTNDVTKPISENETKQKKWFILYFLKFIGFLFGIILLPIINIMIIKFLFETVVLSKKVDMKEIFGYFIRKQNKIEKEDEDDDYLDLEEDDVEMLNVEVLR